MDNSDKVGLNDEQTRFFDVYDGVVVRTQAPQRERILRPRRRFLRRRMDIGGCDSLLASWAFCASCVRMIPRISSFAATTSSTTGLLSSLFFATFAPSTPSSSGSVKERVTTHEATSLDVVVLIFMVFVCRHCWEMLFLLSGVTVSF